MVDGNDDDAGDAVDDDDDDAGDAVIGAGNVVNDDADDAVDDDCDTICWSTV